MPARFHKKVRRMRGSHTHGWGEKKKHRGAGSRGGRGGSNWLYAKKSLTYSYQKDRLGKKGFVPKASHADVRAINLSDLGRIAASKGMKEIDASSLGYNRVLGGGRLDMQLTVRAEQITENAKAKIGQAGGKAVELAPRRAKDDRTASSKKAEGK